MLATAGVPLRARLEPAGLLLVGAALALTVLAPLSLLLLAPLVLGVPHLIADLRYLVLRPLGAPEGVGRAVLLAVGLPLAGLTGLRLMALVGGPSCPAIEPALGGSAVLGAVLLSDGPMRRRLPALALAAMVLALALARPALVVLWLAHLHNLVAIGLWLYWSRGVTSRATRAAVLLTILAGGALIAAGLADGLLAPLGGRAAPSSGLDFDSLAATLAPELAPVTALRLVLLYAFAQALHYVMWLALIPRLATPRRGLHEELGTLPLLLAVVATAAVPLFGCWAPLRARTIYLSLALFHGWLELAIIAHLWMRAPRRASA